MGRSNFFGFMIYDVRTGIKVMSKRYRQGRILILATKTSSIIAGCISGGIALWLIYSNLAPNLGFLISLSLLTGLLFSFGFTGHKIPGVNNSLREWHATEHKLVNLIENGERLRLENLERAPMSHCRCVVGNTILREPSEKKLREALRVGQIYFSSIHLWLRRIDY